MDARDNNSSLADALLYDHRCGFAGTDTISFVFREYAVAFNGSRIIILGDGSGTGTGSKCNAPRMAVMLVHNFEGQPVIRIRLVSSSPEDQQGTAVLDKSPDPRRRGAEGRKEVRIGRVCKSRGDDQAIEHGPEEWCGEHVGGDGFAADPALFDKPVEVLWRCPDKTGTAAHPLITPMGTSRATSREIPTS